jgi:hypothetical protein
MKILLKFKYRVSFKDFWILAAKVLYLFLKTFKRKISKENGLL